MYISLASKGPWSSDYTVLLTMQKVAGFESGLGKPAPENSFCQPSNKLIRFSNQGRKLIRHRKIVMGSAFHVLCQKLCTVGPHHWAM